MKTRLNLRGDVLRRAKARAALRGQTLASYVEEGLEARLEREERQPVQIGEWMMTLPRISAAALADLRRIVEADDFRRIDGTMWA